VGIILSIYDDAFIAGINGRHIMIYSKDPDIESVTKEYVEQALWKEDYNSPICKKCCNNNWGCARLGCKTLEKYSKHSLISILEGLGDWELFDEDEYTCIF